jgi:hypothetical protein
MAEDLGAATYGWDTVYAIRVDDANDAITAAHAWPPNFAVSLPDATLNGSFGSWRIAGGAADVIRLEADLVSVTLVKNGVTTQIPSGTAQFEVRLAYVPGDPVDHVVPKRLQVDAAGAAAAATAGTLSVVVSWPGSDGEPLIQAGVKRCLTSWAGASLDTFHHVFATVDVAERAADGAFAWMVPTYVDYAISADGETGPALLAVLCQTGGRPATGLTPALSPGAIPSDSRAGFLINPVRFLDELVRPALAFVFPGLLPTDMRATNDGLGLGLRAPVILEALQPDTAPPTLVTLDIRVLDEVLLVTSHTKVEIQSNVFAHCQYTAGYRISLGTRSDQSQTLALTADPSSTVDVQNWTEGSTDKLSQAMWGVITGFFGLAFALLTDGASLIASAIVIGLLSGAFPGERQIRTAAGIDDAPAIDLLVLNATHPITWPRNSGLALTSAALNGALQLGGDPKPAT